MIRLLLQWGLSALSLTILSKVLPGFRIKNFGTALAAAAIYGVLHVVLYKVFAFLVFLPIVLTFGLFVFVINAGLLLVTDKLLDDFEIDNLLVTVVAAILLTVLNNVWGRLLF